MSNLDSWSVTPSQFKESFRTHSKAYAILQADLQLNSSGLLLLFYAIECLLKALYTQKQKEPNWNSLPDKAKFKHRLTEIHKACELPNNTTKIRMNEIDEIGDYHEFLRYGNYSQINEEKRNKFNQYLIDLNSWAYEKGGYKRK